MDVDHLPPFLRVPQVQELLQLSRTQVYALTRRWRDTGGREGIPVVCFGGALRIPTQALLRLAQLDDADGSDDAV